MRFSSEAWSGLCLLVAVGLIQRSKLNASRLSLLGIGVVWGLSFEFRFQTGLAVAGLILWLILVRKSSLRDLSWIGLGGGGCRAHRCRHGFFVLRAICPYSIQLF